MNLGELYKFILFVANKAQVGGNLTPEEYNMSLQSTNLRLFKDKTGNDNDYKVGQPFTPKTPEITQKITDDLLPFKVWLGKSGVPPLYIDSDGYAPIPTGFYYPLSLLYNKAVNNNCDVVISPKVIEVLTDNQWDNVIGSYIRKPSYDYPVCNFQNGYIRFAPKDIQIAEFHYLRYPVTPVFDYYISSIGEVIYLPPNTSHVLQVCEEGSLGQLSGTVTSMSVEAEWNQMELMQMASFILEILGVNIRQQDLIQYSQLQQTQ